MKQSFAISMVIGALFALWLFNTGRVASFKQWLQSTPGQPSLPGQPGARPSGSLPRVSGTGSTAGVANTAACAAQVSTGIITPGCAGTFLNELSDPIGAIKDGISTLTFGVLKL